MSFEARVHADIIFHERDETTFSVGSLADHIFTEPDDATISTGTATATPFNLTVPPTVSTIAVKNTGETTLTLAGVVDVSPGRLAIIPTTATFSISAASGNGTYTAICIG